MRLPNFKYVWFRRFTWLRKLWYKFLFFVNNDKTYFYFPNATVRDFIIIDAPDARCSICGEPFVVGQLYFASGEEGGYFNLLLSHDTDGTKCKYGIMGVTVTDEKWKKQY